MENKQKPSSVFLVPCHHSFSSEGILLTEEMLQWPILSFGRYPEEYKEPMRNIILKSALRALMCIEPFHTKVSLGVELENKKLVYAKRTWAEIYLGDQHVLTFSHHSKKNNCAFVDLADWVELGKSPYSTEKEFRDDWQRILTELSAWTVDQWSTFFTERIKMRANQLEGKAKKLRDEAKTFDDSVSDIRLSLAIM